MKARDADGLDVAAYRRRLKILRYVLGDLNQNELAERLGIDFKRWNNYERGYAMPRVVSMRLMTAFPGMSVEWLWFGLEGNLSPKYRKRIQARVKLLRSAFRRGSNC
jgi:transcriptional regulator with XRE-family HTH domain